MKISVLFSTAALVLTGHAQAIPTPDSMASLNQCISWANSVDPRIMMEATTRCQALDGCMRNYSDDKESLVECTNTAEVVFAEAIGKLRYPGEIPSTNLEAPVITEKAASTLYERKGGEAKGWENADLGD